MLLFNFDLLLANPLLFLRILTAIAFALVVSITVHEASHALVATVQGDFTARRLHRLSLNPMNHLDPAGTVMLFLVGFGWGKPVPVNPFWLKLGPRIGTALVALAGPASNIAMAALFALPVRFGLAAWHNPNSGFGPFAQTNPASIIADLLGFVIFYNVILAVFNLIPIAPLDGFKVALGILPRGAAASFARLEPYGPGILMLLILSTYVFHVGIFTVLQPLIRALSLVVVGRAI